MSEELIRLSNVSLAYEGENVLKSLNLSIADKEFLTLLGPSGCGKTTTLRIIGGFETPQSGDVFFEGKSINNLPSFKRNVNTVFQKYALFPHLNVYENIAFGLRIKRLPEVEIKRRITEMLEIVSLSGFEKRSVNSLSGGQQQRVAIARALVNRPQVLLLDEPLGALDLKLRKEMQIELKEMQQKLGITFVYVTHDQEEALTMSDTVVVMNDGVILQTGTPQNIYNEPANAFVADFIGEANIIDGFMLRDCLVSFEGHTYECVDSGFAQNEPVDIVIRPEDVDICPVDEGVIAGLAESRVFKGVHYEIVVNVDNYKWYIHTTDSYETGCMVGLKFGPEDIHIMKKMFTATTNLFDGRVVEDGVVDLPELGGRFDADTAGLAEDTPICVELPPDAMDITSEDVADFPAYIDSMIYKGRYNEFIVVADSGRQIIFHSQIDAQVASMAGIRVDFSRAILTQRQEEHKG